MTTTVGISHIFRMNDATRVTVHTVTVEYKKI